jgi:signal transduction histidine kinase
MKHTLYRIAQEALNNIVKHVHASIVTVRLAEEDQEIHFEVRDNGRGFEPEGPFPGHLGLHSMQERVTKVGGVLMIESVPGQGTRVDVRLPMVPGR